MTLPRIARRALKALLLVLLCWGILAWSLDLYGRSHHATGQWDAIVVLGARVWTGGRPSGTIVRRATRGAELYHEGRAPVLVLTGGVGPNPPSEARAAAGVVKQLGVPDSALVLEERSRSTEENAAFAREKLGSKRVLVVTSAYHVLRAELIFERYFPEAQVVGVPLGWRPPVGGSLREVLALGWYFVSRPFE